MPSKRPLQVADRIKEIIANALESRVKDPRLGFVTITDVRVTGDLQQASIFYTVLVIQQLMRQQQQHLPAQRECFALRLAEHLVCE